MPHHKRAGPRDSICPGTLLDPTQCLVSLFSLKHPLLSPPFHSHEKFFLIPTRMTSILSFSDTAWLIHSFLCISLPCLANGDDVTSPWKQMLNAQLLSNDMLQDDVIQAVTSWGVGVL